jgi:LEA14-like dessication related protein
MNAAKRAACIVLALACLCALGCDTLIKQIQGRYNLINCDFSIDSVEPKLHVNLADITQSTVDLVINTVIRNPNDSEVILDKMAFDLYVDDALLTTGSQAWQLNVPAGAKKTFPIVTSLGYSTVVGAGPALWDRINGKTATYRIDGTIYLDTPVGSFSYGTTIKQGTF